jgi:hypothetical protein
MERMWHVLFARNWVVAWEYINLESPLFETEIPALVIYLFFLSILLGFFFLKPSLRVECLFNCIALKTAGYF